MKHKQYCFHASVGTILLIERTSSVGEQSDNLNQSSEYQIFER